ncbi:MAG: hypothetical protein KC476_07730 [Cyanobacteria bacterium HKST-UBA06]|nr:hypothetical protein [Cyanobacteria bacterium HKST-UBA06]
MEIYPSLQKKLVAFSKLNVEMAPAYAVNTGYPAPQWAGHTNWNDLRPDSFEMTSFTTLI